MNPNKKAKIMVKAQVRALIFNEASTIILVEYFDYSDIFFSGKQSRASRIY